MKELNRQKILLGVLGLTVIVAVFYYSNLWRSSEVIVAITSPTETTVVGEEVLILVNRLKSVTIDPTVFQDSLFSSLKDISVKTTPENIARPNPFAPIGVDSGILRLSERITAAESR